MQAKDKIRFITAMAVMAECFQKEPSDTMAEVYWRVLADMDIETFEAACLTLVNTRQITGTFPLVSEIREAAGGGEAAKALRVVTAWDKLMYAIHRHAPYDSVRFDDPIVTHICRQWGGWVDMGDWSAEETKWKRKEFEKMYLAYMAADNLPAATEHLVGLQEAENRARFPDFVPKPLLIAGSTGAFRSVPYDGDLVKMLDRALLGDDK